MESYREKSKSQATFEKLYNSLKQQQIAAGLESAADRDAENVLNSVSGIRHHAQKKYGGAGSPGSGSSDKRRAQMHTRNPWHNGPGATAARVQTQSSRKLLLIV